MFPKFACPLACQEVQPVGSIGRQPGSLKGWGKPWLGLSSLGSIFQGLSLVPTSSGNSLWIQFPLDRASLGFKTSSLASVFSVLGMRVSFWGFAVATTSLFTFWQLSSVVTCSKFPLNSQHSTCFLTGSWFREARGFSSFLPPSRLSFLPSFQKT